jgi:23S rRNA pseudouridine1911/1915/1917 synthase
MPARDARPGILFEDQTLLVLNKPAGLVVHPAPSHHGPTLMDWLKEYLGSEALEQFEDPERLGLVHRLDKDTSGVLLVTKTPAAKTDVGRQFHDRLVRKQYIAFIEGVPVRKMGIISAPIGRSRKVPSRMAVTSTGRPSETTFEVVEKLKEVSLVTLFPKTGRTHQLRVHCAAIGHPIVGDHTYGSKAKWAKDDVITRPLLHAEHLELEHPGTHKRVHFEAPWPQDMKKALTLFRRMAKAALVFMVLTVAAGSVQADESSASSPAAPIKHKTTSSTSGGSSSSTSSSLKAVKREMASMKEQFKSLIEEVSAVQDRVTNIQSSLDQLNASGRLRDLEKAISDLNGKAVSTSNVTEETKSQVLDLSRKVKAQQDALEQLRDQLDHLQREVTNQKAREETPPAAVSGGSQGK